VEDVEKEDGFGKARVRNVVGEDSRGNIAKQ